jgi:hypothetical protein
MQSVEYMTSIKKNQMFKIYMCKCISFSWNYIKKPKLGGTFIL